jgi:hypothetical protein
MLLSETERGIVREAVGKVRYRWFADELLQVLEVFELAPRRRLMHR